MIFGKIVGRVMHGFKVVGHVAGKRRAIGLFPGDIKDARVGGCSTKILCHAKVRDRGCLHSGSKVFAQLFTICRSHPFVGCDVADMPALLEQAHAALIKKAINIAAGGVGCVILGLPDFFVRSAKLLNLNIGRVADNNVKAWLQRWAKHGGGLKKFGHAAVIVGVPVDALLFLFAAKAQPLQFGENFFPQVFILFAQPIFFAARRGGKVLVAHIVKPGFKQLDIIVFGQAGGDRSLDIQGDKTVGDYKPGFKVGQGANIAIFGAVVACFLITYKRDEKAQLGNLNGNGLNVDAVDAVFNQIQFASVVELIAFEAGINGRYGAAARFSVFNFFGLVELALVPFAVVGVEFAQHKHQLVQNAHGVGAKAAGRVKNLGFVNGGNKGIGLGVGKGMLLFGIGNQNIQPGCSVFGIGFGQALAQRFGQVAFEHAVNHIFHSGAQCIK